jgi:hypothetical protein
VRGVLTFAIWRDVFCPFLQASQQCISVVRMDRDSPKRHQRPSVLGCPCASLVHQRGPRGLLQWLPSAHPPPGLPGSKVRMRHLLDHHGRATIGRSRDLSGGSFRARIVSQSSCLERAIYWIDRTLFINGRRSSADQPFVSQSSKSTPCARVYIMKLIELPPPSMPPHGTIALRPLRASSAFAS